MEKILLAILLLCSAIEAFAQKTYTDGEYYIKIESKKVLIIGTTSESAIFSGHVSIGWGIASVAHDLGSGERSTDINVYKSEDIVDGYPLHTADEIDDPNFLCYAPYKRIEADGKGCVKDFFKAISKCKNGAALELKLRDSKTDKDFSYFWCIPQETINELVSYYKSL